MKSRSFKITCWEGTTATRVSCAGWLDWLGRCINCRASWRSGWSYGAVNAAGSCPNGFWGAYRPLPLWLGLDPLAVRRGDNARESATDRMQAIYQLLLSSSDFSRQLVNGFSSERQWWLLPAEMLQEVSRENACSACAAGPQRPARGHRIGACASARRAVASTGSANPFHGVQRIPAAAPPE
jgi:hypothetical protein